MGLACFKKCKDLAALNLGRTKVSDDGLATFKNCTNLRELHLTGAMNVTDAGLAHFALSKDMLIVDLSDTNVTDKGLAALKPYTRLENLILARTAIGDAGLAHVHGHRNLKMALLVQTKVTAKGIGALHEALPNCKIIADHKAAPNPPPYVPVRWDEKEAKRIQQEWATKLKAPVEEKSKLGIMMMVSQAARSLPGQ